MSESPNPQPLSREEQEQYCLDEDVPLRQMAERFRATCVALEQERDKLQREIVRLHEKLLERV